MNTLENLIDKIDNDYPPHKYVFSPLYKFFRKKIGFNMYASNFSVWTTSAILHGGFVGTGRYLSNNSYTEGIIFGGFFLSCGIYTTWLKYNQMKNRRKLIIYRKQTTSSTQQHHLCASKV